MEGSVRRGGSAVTSASAPAARGATELDLAFTSERAFRAWYDAVLPRVYGYVMAHAAAGPELAEDITQQTFVEALRDHDRFDGRSDVVTWLCAIARHKLADHYRRLDREERRQLRLEVRAIETGDADVAPWSAVEDRELVQRALATLPPLQRAALLFRYLDGSSTREIASALHRSESAVESLLSRARTNFRFAFGESDV